MATGIKEPERNSELGDALPGCPVDRAVRAIGGKWKMLVLRALLLGGPQRFNQLLAEIDGISAKELTRNLRELEEVGIVERNGSSGAQHVEYGCTELGHALMPAFKCLAEFGEALRRAAV